jgi:hypothetical protein
MYKILIENAQTNTSVAIDVNCCHPLDLTHNIVSRYLDRLLNLDRKNEQVPFTLAELVANIPALGGAHSYISFYVIIDGQKLELVLGVDEIGYRKPLPKQETWSEWLKKTWAKIVGKPLAQLEDKV